MHFKYCPHCGSQLKDRGIGDEGAVPYCESCNVPLFDMFSSCIIALVVNQNREALLLRQGYISHQFDRILGKSGSCRICFVR